MTFQLKTAWRNLVKEKRHAITNIIGLSLGMAVAILIGLWMHDELSFNKNFKNYDHIAQVYQNLDNNGERVTWFNQPFPLANELRTNYGSDFKHIVMGANWNTHLLTIGNKKVKLSGGFFEKEMPQMFTLHMVAGSRDMSDLSSLLISEAAAKACFGNANAIGQIVKIDEMPPLKVTGVYKDFPVNCTLSGLNFVGNWEFNYNTYDLKSNPDPWRPNFTTIWVQLNDNADINAVNRHIRDAKLKKLNAHLATKKPALFLHPMAKWHLYNEFKNGINTGGAVQYVRMFGIIGVFVILLACINFMNLSTARSEKRAKEVGIRKTLGSMRKQLIFQFFGESLLTVTISAALAVLVVSLTLPFFSEIAGKQMQMLWNNITFWLIVVAFVAITALIAGSYPALYLSSFNPVKVLKGTFRPGRLAALPRKALVVVQFTVSVSLIIGTLIVFKQIEFARNRPVGYSRANLIAVPVSNANIHTHFEAVKGDLIKSGMVASLAESESPTTEIWNTTSGVSWPGKDPNLSTDFNVVAGSFDYGQTVAWKIKEGRGFSREMATDSAAVVLNEAAVKYMDLKNPVGETITWWGQPLRVIGVVENMVMESPYAEARPVIYPLLKDASSMVQIRLAATASASAAIREIEKVFTRYNPGEPFEFSFVSDDYNKKFGDEERIGSLAGIFTVLAIVISCLGLFGLTSFVAERRRKEIGVRKVLGASVFNVWNLISKDLVILVAISFIIAIPLSYYFMHQWLQHYVYRTVFSWWIFVAACVGTLLITLFTVSFQTIKAAIANPVKSLRTE
jgi:ABC-type antimicrobial peptide transport system permease subunit